ncbi:hypothetical protein CHCC20375_3578 [Bacillus licheniformis]|nr:hypothetical protein CHCC20375_3578 [Bacillus licheniformis]
MGTIYFGNKAIKNPQLFRTADFFTFARAGWAFRKTHRAL